MNSCTKRWCVTVWTLLLLFATQLTGAQEITDPAVPSREASSRVRYIHLQSDTDTGARWRPEGDSGETWLAGSAANASEPPNLGEDSYYTYDDQKIPLEIVPGGFVLRDRGQPDNQHAGSLIESDIARIAGKGLHRQALGYGYATFSVVPLDTLWARRNASSPPPLDQFHAYRWARKVIRSLASYSTTQDYSRGWALRVLAALHGVPTPEISNVLSLVWRADRGVVRRQRLACPLGSNPEGVDRRPHRPNPRLHAVTRTPCRGSSHKRDDGSHPNEPHCHAS